MSFVRARIRAHAKRKPSPLYRLYLVDRMDYEAKLTNALDVFHVHLQLVYLRKLPAYPGVDFYRYVHHL